MYISCVYNYAGQFNTDDFQRQCMKSVTENLEDSFLAFQTLQNQQWIKFKTYFKQEVYCWTSSDRKHDMFIQKKHLNLNPDIWQV